MFNSIFVRYKDSGEVKDILGDGEYSCAFFVSSVLYLFQTISKSVSTVKSLKELIDASDVWKSVSLGEIQSGDVIFWEKTKFDDGSENAHVGFVLNKEEAVSTDYKTKMVTRHPIKSRSIDSIYRYVW